jgi:hypothetical protein
MTLHHTLLLFRHFSWCPIHRCLLRRRFCAIWDVTSRNEEKEIYHLRTSQRTLKVQQRGEAQFVIVRKGAHAECSSFKYSLLAGSSKASSWPSTSSFPSVSTTYHGQSYFELKTTMPLSLIKSLIEPRKVESPTLEISTSPFDSLISYRTVSCPPFLRSLSASSGETLTPPCESPTVVKSCKHCSFSFRRDERQQDNLEFCSKGKHILRHSTSAFVTHVDN